MDTEALVATLHNRFAVVRVKKLKDKLFQVGAEAMVDTMANKLAQVKIESLA